MLIRTIVAHSLILLCLFSPSLLEARNFENLRVALPNMRGVTDVAFHRQNNDLIIRTRNGRLFILDIDKPNKVPEMLLPAERPVLDGEEDATSLGRLILVSPDGESIALLDPPLVDRQAPDDQQVIEDTGLLRVFRIDGADQVPGSYAALSNQPPEHDVFQLKYDPRRAAFSPDGRYVAVGYIHVNADKTHLDDVQVFDLETRQVVSVKDSARLICDGGRFADLQFIPNRSKPTLLISENRSRRSNDATNGCDQITQWQIDGNGDGTLLVRQKRIGLSNESHLGTVSGPADISVDPAGTKVAVTFDDRFKFCSRDGHKEGDRSPHDVRLLTLEDEGPSGPGESLFDAEDLTYQVPAWWCFTSWLNRISWDAEGEHLYVSGFKWSENDHSIEFDERMDTYKSDQRVWTNVLLRWRVGKSKPALDRLPFGVNTVRRLLAIGSRTVVGVTTDGVVLAAPSTSQIGADTEILFAPPGLSYRTEREFSVSYDAHRVVFCSYPHRYGRRYQIDLSDSENVLVRRLFDPETVLETGSSEEIEGVLDRYRSEPCWENATTLPHLENADEYYDHYYSQDLQIHEEDGGILGWKRANFKMGQQQDEEQNRIVDPDGEVYQLPGDERRILKDKFRSFDPLLTRRKTSHFALVGSDRFLRVLPKKYNQAVGYAYLPIPHAAYRVNAIRRSDEDYFFVVAHSDSVIRWYRYRGKGTAIEGPIFNLYIEQSDPHAPVGYILWSKSGLFQANQSGLLSLDRLRFETGDDVSPSSSSPISLFRKYFNCPGVLQSIGLQMNEEEGVRAYLRQAGGNECGILEGFSADTFRISDLRDKTAALLSSAVEIKHNAVSRGADLVEVILRIDDPEDLAGEVDLVARDFELQDLPHTWHRDDLDTGRTIRRLVRVPAGKRCLSLPFRYQISVKDRGGKEISLANGRLEWRNDDLCEITRSLEAFVVARDYKSAPDKGWHLNGARADGADFVDAICAQAKSGVWKEVIIHLVSEDNSPLAIRSCDGIPNIDVNHVVFENLSAITNYLNRRLSEASIEMQKDPSHRKHIHFYMSGHGGSTQAKVSDGFNFILNHDAMNASLEMTGSSILSFETLVDTLSNGFIPQLRKRVHVNLFYDACRRETSQVGQVLEVPTAQQLYDMAEDNFPFEGIFMSTRPKELSYECKICEGSPGETDCLDKKWRGLFSYGLGRALRGQVRYDHATREDSDKLLHPMELRYLLQRNTRRLSLELKDSRDAVCSIANIQHPDIFVSSDADFPMAFIGR